MTKQNPQVSIVIRTKNESKFVGKVLSLLYKQTFKDFEIIIVDSGSTDKTLEIVNKFPVKVLKILPEKFTFGYALNFGINKARGKYICILSGHSIPISDSWLEDGVKVIKEGGVAGLSGHWNFFILGYYSRILARFTFLLPHFKWRQDFDPLLTNTNSLISKSHWQEYKFDETLEGSEDYDWASEMIARGYNIVKYKPFSVFHSHFMLGRPGYFATKPIWTRQVAEIDKKKRPSVNKD